MFSGKFLQTLNANGQLPLEIYCFQAMEGRLQGPPLTKGYVHRRDACLMCSIRNRHWYSKNSSHSSLANWQFETCCYRVKALRMEWSL